MDLLPFAMIRSQQLMHREATSALPDAPVVPFVEQAHPVGRTRVAVAAVLYRLGDLLAPARPVRRTSSLGC